MHWPQWTILTLATLGMAAQAASSNKPAMRAGAIVGALAELWVLWMGGFFA